jgi:lipoprotein-anchoring transpeptidase ErfK/SrfK
LGIGSRISAYPKITVIVAAGAVLAAAGGLTAFTVAGHGHPGRTSATADGVAAAAHNAESLKVLSASPADGSHGVNGTTAITLTFNQPLPASAPFPRVSPAIAGSWQRSGNSVTFTPATGFPERTQVRIEVPGYTATFTTAKYPTLRLQELLAQLGYLPLSWTPVLGGTVTPGSAQAQLAAAYSPPTGSFSWERGYPSALHDFWQQGSPNMLDTGAVTGFEADHHLQTDGVASASVWKALLAAAAAGQQNTHGYSYAIASKYEPETLTVWHDGHEVLSSPANTGIGVAPTTDGTFPVYEKLTYQIMQGTNPNGSHYADPVQWVSYFDGGQAVHYIARGSFGWPQSLGCVELPYSEAERSYYDLPYGSLVTVTG